MATERYYLCPECHTRTEFSGLLFDAFHNFPASLPSCSCGGKKQLILVPPFAHGAGGSHFRVLDVFYESVSWNDESGNAVTFYPFLVVTQPAETNGLKVWLPYWHAKEESKEFGERAPWMDAVLLERLLAKAQAKGYLSVGLQTLCEARPEPS